MGFCFVEWRRCFGLVTLSVSHPWASICSSFPNAVQPEFFALQHQDVKPTESLPPQGVTTEEKLKSWFHEQGFQSKTVFFSKLTAFYLNAFNNWMVLWSIWIKNIMLNNSLCPVLSFFDSKRGRMSLIDKWARALHVEGVSNSVLGKDLESHSLWSTRYTEDAI